MSTNPTIPDEILVSLGLDALSEEDRAMVLGDIAKVVFQAVVRRAWNVLSVKQQDQLLVHLEESIKDPDDMVARGSVEAFLRANVPDFERYLEEETKAFLATQQKLYGEIVS